jgi:diguanylate cyclase (GGDEF)-like protein
MLTGASFVKKYLTSIGLLICLVILSVFWGFYFRSTELIENQLLYQGQAFFQEVVLTRQWAAQHNGVYVRMDPGVTVNPYLLQVPGLKVVIRDQEEQQYTLKNPALITREISELANQKGLFRFHITSLKPLNPNNAADSFEQAALNKFNSNVKEFTTFETKDNEVFYRYMAPLVTEKSCLTCHSHQGYKEGDIRGGISVTISATEIADKIRESRLFLLISAILIILLILAIIYFLARSFIKDLHDAEQKLVDMATHDHLTSLFNRREAYRKLGEELAISLQSQQPLSLLLIDLDHFKRVNDTHGHSAGDIVLQSVADAMRQCIGLDGFCCRYGGEEFLVVLPGASFETAIAVAEKLRLQIEKLEMPVSPGTLLRITASIGVATLKEGETVDQLVSQADSAMYQAKKMGRNRISGIPSPDLGS